MADQYARLNETERALLQEVRYMMELPNIPASFGETDLRPFISRVSGLFGEIRNLRVKLKAAEWSARHNYEALQQEIARSERNDKALHEIMGAVADWDSRPGDIQSGPYDPLGHRRIARAALFPTPAAPKE